MMTELWQRFCRLLGSVRSIVVNTSWLVSTTAVNALLGLAYWGTAARFFPPELVGTAAATVAAMFLISTFGSLGFGSLLLGGLSGRRDARALVATAILTIGIVSAVLGVATAQLASTVDHDLAVLRHDPLTIAIFALGGIVMTISLVLDEALIGVGRGAWQFWRNAAFAALKLALLIALELTAPESVTWLTIYGTWVVAMLVSLVGVALLTLARDRFALARYRPRWHLLRGVGRLAVGHHIINLALTLPGQVLPLVVTAVLSSTENAYFYISWQFAGFIFVPPVALSVSLYAAANSPGALSRKLRFTLGAALAVGLVSNALVFLGGGFALGLYGGDYAAEATWPLRLLGLGVFPLIIKDHYVALCRITGRLGSAIPLIVVGCLLEVVVAAIGGALGGLNGLALGWSLAVTVEALVMGLPVLRAALASPTPTDSAPTLSPRVQARHYLPWWARTEAEYD
jgi:O-antigen/teichoic acid export membrane protein